MLTRLPPDNSFLENMESCAIETPSRHIVRSITKLADDALGGTPIIHILEHLLGSDDKQVRPSRLLFLHVNYRRRAESSSRDVATGGSTPGMPTMMIEPKQESGIIEFNTMIYSTTVGGLRRRGVPGPKPQ